MTSWWRAAVGRDAWLVSTQSELTQSSTRGKESGEDDGITHLMKEMAAMRL